MKGIALGDHVHRFTTRPNAYFQAFRMWQRLSRNWPMSKFAYGIQDMPPVALPSRRTILPIHMYS